MNWISTTIKKEYMAQILGGKKTVEYKGAKEYWEKRLDKYRGQHDGDLGINFLCGQKSYRYEVKSISLWYHTGGKEVAGEDFHYVYHIELGERIKEKER